MMRRRAGNLLKDQLGGKRDRAERINRLVPTLRLADGYSLAAPRPGCTGDPSETRYGIVQAWPIGCANAPR